MEPEYFTQPELEETWISKSSNCFKSGVSPQAKQLFYDHHEARHVVRSQTIQVAQLDLWKFLLDLTATRPRCRVDCILIVCLTDERFLTRPPTINKHMYIFICNSNSRLLLLLHFLSVFCSFCDFDGASGILTLRVAVSEEECFLLWQQRLSKVWYCVSKDGRWWKKGERKGDMERR